MRSLPPPLDSSADPPRRHEIGASTSKRSSGVEDVARGRRPGDRLAAFLAPSAGAASPPPGPASAPGRRAPGSHTIMALVLEPTPTEWKTPTEWISGASTREKRGANGSPSTCRRRSRALPAAWLPETVELASAATSHSRARPLLPTDRTKVSLDSPRARPASALAEVGAVGSSRGLGAGTACMAITDVPSSCARQCASTAPVLGSSADISPEALPAATQPPA